MHRERVTNIKSMVDTSIPLAATLNHVVNNLKREQKLEERYSEIDRANRILLTKMSDIMRQPPALTPREERRPGPQSLNRDARKKELLRITKENQSILKRIQQAQPVYNHVEHEGIHRKNQAYMKNCAEYPVVLGTPRKTPRQMGASSELVPLEPEPRSQEVMDSALSSGQMRFVLKEGQWIGGQFYQIEMLTDGSQLLISAFNDAFKEAFELTVKEKPHRKLYREINGDYSLLLRRLAMVDGGTRLVLQEDVQYAPGPMPPNAPSLRPQALLQQQALAPQQAQPATRQAWLPEEEVDADSMVAARVVQSAGSAYNEYDTGAELQVDDNGDPQVRFRGLTP